MNKFLTITMFAVLLLLPKVLIPAAEPSKATDLKTIPTAQLIQEIIDEYKIKGSQDCISWRSKQPTPDVNFEYPHQEACVVAGYKHVYLKDYSDDLFEKDLDNPEVMNPKIRELMSRPDSPVGYFFCLDNDGISRLIMYTKARNGELNAYRLVLSLLQEDASTQYLTGILLGYPVNGIQFYYQAFDFLAKQPEQQTIKNYGKWSQDLKKQFEKYKQLQSNKDELKKSKDEAEKWLAEKNIKLSDVKEQPQVLEILQTNNPYLIGRLMRKSEDEIEFIILGTLFLRHVAKIKQYTVHNYSEWPASMKEAFAQYEKSPEGLKDVQADAAKARQWLAQNGRKSIPQLKAEIKTLEAEIAKAKEAAAAEQAKQTETPPPHIEKQQKETGVTVSVLDYDPKRDFNDIVKVHEQFNDKELKFLRIEKRSEMMKKINDFYNLPPEQLKQSDKPGLYSAIKILRSANNELIGVVDCKYERDSEGHLSCDIADIFVSNKFQGKGFGRQLMNIGIEFFTKLRCTDITLQVDPENTGAKALYEKLGFEEVARTSDSIYMQKMIK